MVLLDLNSPVSDSSILSLDVLSEITVYIHCITLYYAQQEISGKTGKTSKFGPIHSTIQIWTDFHENEAKKKNFF